MEVLDHRPEEDGLYGPGYWMNEKGKLATKQHSRLVKTQGPRLGWTHG